MIAEGRNTMAKYTFKLYITGSSRRSRLALDNVKWICQSLPESEEYDLQVIDVLNDPQQAEEDNIIATPTLLKTDPLPAQRIIGDMTDRERVMARLVYSA